jgi:hypothetical protein
LNKRNLVNLLSNLIMTKKKLKTLILNIGGKKKKLKVNESTYHVYVGCYHRTFYPDQGCNNVASPLA